MPQYKTLPDKYIRKGIYTALGGLTVNGVPVPIYDQRIPVEQAPEAYILFDTQSASPAKDTKCQYDWNCGLRLEVINQVPMAGNPGSRVLADDIAGAVVSAFNVLFQLDPASGLKIIWQNIEAGIGGTVQTRSFQIYRKPLICTFYVI